MRRLVVPSRILGMHSVLQCFQTLGSSRTMRFEDATPRLYSAFSATTSRPDDTTGDGSRSQSVQRRFMKWQASEDKVIDDAIREGRPHSDCVEMLPNRTPSAVYTRFKIKHVAIRGRRRGKDGGDTEAVIALAKNGLTANEIQKCLPHLLPKAIHSTAYLHGLSLAKDASSSGGRRRWTEHEVDIVRSETSIYTMAAKLPHRTIEAISQKIIDLKRSKNALPGRRRWTHAADSKLISEYSKGAALTEIGAILGRSYHSLDQRLKTLGLRNFGKENLKNVEASTTVCNELSPKEDAEMQRDHAVVVNETKLRSGTGTLGTHHKAPASGNVTIGRALGSHSSRGLSTMSSGHRRQYSTQPAVTGTLAKGLESKLLPPEYRRFPWTVAENEILDKAILDGETAHKCFKQQRN